MAPSLHLPETPFADQTDITPPDAELIELAPVTMVGSPAPAAFVIRRMAHFYA